MPVYVRLSFVPHGARRRTVWAKRLSAGHYLRVSRSGNPWFVRRGIETREVIVCAETDHTARPARMNLKYARLELT